MNDIFRYFIGNADSGTRLAYAEWFCEHFPVNEFSADELLYRECLAYCAKLNVPLRRRTLDVWISTELRKQLLKHRVKVAGCESLNFEDPVAFETAVQTTRQILQDDFNVLEALPTNTDEFALDMDAFIHQRRNERITDILTATYAKLSETEDTQSTTDYMMDSVASLNEIYNSDILDDFQDTAVKHKPRKVADTGLPAIDADSGGIYTTQLLGIEAQPGTGKTRFALGQVMYRALTIYKTNCLYISLEQNVVELEAMLVAKHCFTLFGIQVNDSLIWKDKVPEDLKSKVEAARIDLFDSGKYGKFKPLKEVLYVETFISRLRTLDKLKGPFDLIAIDYMGLIESKPAKWQKSLQDYEKISEAFKLFKRYLEATDKAGIAISQFNDKGIEAGKADKEISTNMAQGGITVYRNTDFNIAMSRTDTMKAQQKCRFQQPKVRDSAGFGTFLATTRLGICYFDQIANKEV